MNKIFILTVLLITGFGLHFLFDNQPTTSDYIPISNEKIYEDNISEVEVEKIIKSYFKLSSERNFSKLKMLIIKTPDSHWTQQNDENSTSGRKKEENLTSSDKMLELSPSDFSEFSNYSYTEVSELYPQMIYERKMFIKAISNKWLNVNEYRVKVDVESAENLSAPTSHYVYLAKDKTNEWKIFKVDLLDLQLKDIK